MASAGTAAVQRRTFRIPSLGAIWRIFRRYPVIPIFILSSLVVIGIFAPLVAPHDPLDSVLRNTKAPPAWYAKGTANNLFGADYIGRDVLSRVIYGARVSLIVVSVATCSSFIVGTLFGLTTGYFGGRVDDIMMRLVDLWLGLPYLLIALVATVVFGHSFAVLVGLLALLAWPDFVRYIRAEVLSLKTRDYISLAKVSGASTLRIMFIHILPGVINTIIVLATLRIGQLIMMEAILSFLGAGIPPPTPAWGAMVAEGRDYLSDAWWISFFPGLAIFLVVMSLNFLGDWLRDYLDPRLRQL
jgi:peptide/nickel transport system permease protein